MEENENDEENDAILLLELEAESKPVRKRLIMEPEDESSISSLSKKMVMSGKILERMVNQNSCFEIAQGE